MCIVCCVKGVWEDGVCVVLQGCGGWHVYIVVWPGCGSVCVRYTYLSSDKLACVPDMCSWLVLIIRQ